MLARLEALHVVIDNLARAADLVREGVLDRVKAGKDRPFFLYYAATPSHGKA